MERHQGYKNKHINKKLLCVLDWGYDEAGNLSFRACLVVFLSWIFVLYLTGPKFDVHFIGEICLNRDFSRDGWFVKICE